MVRKKDKLVFGWGINDVDYPVCKYGVVGGKKRMVWTCPYYVDWKTMLMRCFDQNYHSTRPTYRGCSVCSQWRNLSSFIEWVDSQPNKDWRSCQLDKDFLVFDNKHYSPETCVYITSSINNLITCSDKARGLYMIGVNYVSRNQKKPYKSACMNPFTKKKEHLGSFETEMEAHLAWKARKHEHACALAETQIDSRVVQRLKEIYSFSAEWVSK